jgi:Na+/proline symporter
LSEKVVWLLAFVGLYWVFCLYWGFAAARIATDARSFFLADRNLPAWVFVLAATGASVSGWMYFGHAELIRDGGLPAATLALAAVTIPLGGVIVMKRQWMLGKRYGYVTPAEMLGEYHASEPMRLIVLAIALVFAIPFAGMQIGAAGTILAAVSDGAVDRTTAMWISTAVVFTYVCFGGLRAAAYVGALQALLLGAGIVGLGVFAFWQLGGFAAFNADLARMSAAGVAVQGHGPNGPFSFFSVPGVIQFTGGVGWEAPDGGLWTGVMILSYAVGLMGLQLMPSFSMLGFAARSPKGFRAQQTWATGGVMGAILLVFPVATGLGAHFLGADPDVTAAGLSRGTLLEGGTPGGVVAATTAAIGGAAPWFAALFAVCALAAAQGLAALTLSTTSTMLVRDVYRRYVDPALDVEDQRLYARITMAVAIVVALLMASFAPGAQALLGSLAVGFGVQLLPALAAVCWLPWITPPAALVGLVTGLVFVIFTEPFGIALAGFFGLDLPWGRWPWTIHSAGWGIVFNVAVCFLVSLISQRADDRARRQPYHDFLAAHAGYAPKRHVMRPVAWAAALAWLFFAVGPGVLFGNFAFGDVVDTGDGWRVGMPPLWGWQVLWWALGVLLLWLLATRMRMSTVPIARIDLLPRSQRPPSTYAAGGTAMARSWFWIVVAAGAAAVLVNWMFG